MAASVKDVKMDWAGHALPALKVEVGDTLPTAVIKWRTGTARATIAATKSPWFMQTMLSLKRPKSSMTLSNLFQSDGNGSDKIDVLAEFEETEKTSKIVVGRAMKHKALISTEKLDDVAKDKDKIEAAFDKFMYYLSESNSHMTKATAEAAPTQHSIAEAKYGQGLGNPFGGLAVWFLLTCTAEKHEQKRIDVMLEELAQYVNSACKRAVDVAAYLQKINV